MIEKEHLVRPEIEKSTHGFVDWMEDVGNITPGFKFHDGRVLVKAEWKQAPFSDNAHSIHVEICSTYPECPSCTKRNTCLVSNFKK
jgi:hypothetical protein